MIKKDKRIFLHELCVPIHNGIRSVHSWDCIGFVRINLFLNIETRTDFTTLVRDELGNNNDQA